MNLELDQHFLKNKEILNLIINNAQISDKDHIFEIGTGEGILTKELIKTKAQRIISIEKDITLESKLKSINSDKLDLIIGSNGLEEIKKHVFTKLIANIPYSITEPLYKLILDLKVNFAILLHGEKFYNLIKNENSKWHYFINSYYEIKLLKKVEGNEFKPKAKVSSVLIKLTQKKKLNKKDIFFQNLFERRERNTKNAIIYTLVETHNLTKNEAIEKTKNNTFPNKKLENLSNEEFINMIMQLKPI